MRMIAPNGVAIDARDDAVTSLLGMGFQPVAKQKAARKRTTRTRKTKAASK